MIFSSMAAPRICRAVAGLAAVVALGLAAACGGSTSQAEPFVAQRYFAFGDETSLLLPTGRKYTANALAADGSLDCSANAIWTQQMAALYGFTFAECNFGGLSAQAKMYAEVGARVAEVAAQVDVQVAAGGFRDKDLATVMAGANDILELYARYPRESEANLQAEASARGRRLAQVVNRLVDLGSKVVLANIPDMGLTPFAFAERAAKSDTDRAALLSRLSQSFNNQVGVTIRLDGRYIGLVQSDQWLLQVVRNPGGAGFSNVTDGVCATPLPLCSTQTLVPGGDAGLYFWADGTRLSPGAQSRLANLAIDRARNNPF